MCWNKACLIILCYGFYIAEPELVSRMGNVSKATHIMKRQPFGTSNDHGQRISRTKRDSLQNAYIESMNIVCRIGSRFSTTHVKSLIFNPTRKNKETVFDHQIPEMAFISNFTMMIDGVLIVTEVKSNEDAQKMYDEAKEQNKTAGMVSSTPHPPKNGMEMFSVAITVKQNSKVEVELTYLQLLERFNGIYEQVISMRPNQIVNDFKADIYVYDKQGVVDMNVFEPYFSSNSSEYQISMVENFSNNLKHVSYSPTRQQQQVMDKDKGLNGNFMVRYDINHQNDGGHVRMENKYFAHYFSLDEETYTPLAKNIIFVIDISSSMSGRKMNQTQEAMQTILGQLHSSDTFMLLLFDDQLEYWPSSKTPVVASPNNILKAQMFASQKLYAKGATNIDAALNFACKTLRGQGNMARSNLVVFLTDGEPTAGETNSDRIVAKVTEAAAGQVSIFSLAFGRFLDFELLKKLAFRTGGKMLPIYESKDASAQLKNYYKTISSPLIFDIKIEYPPNVVDTGSVTQTKFNQYFKGSELVVVGKLVADVQEVAQEWKFDVMGTRTEKIELVTIVDTVQASVVTPEAEVAYQDGFLEKLYVYMKIKSLLREVLLTDDVKQQKDLEDQALQLALEYRFVTPLTSMIIIQQEKDRYVTSDESLTHDYQNQYTFNADIQDIILEQSYYDMIPMLSGAQTVTWPYLNLSIAALISIKFL